MAFLVVAYPRFARADHDWIQAYRSKHDPQFDVVAPHFTLVFPVSQCSEKDFIAEIVRRIEGVKCIDFVVDHAVMARDDAGEFFHEFLVPSRGHGDIMQLHEQLYSGSLSEHLRSDIAFIPHITIGRADNAGEGSERVSALNARPLRIPGTIDALDVIQYTGKAVTTAHVVELA